MWAMAELENVLVPEVPASLTWRVGHFVGILEVGWAGVLFSVLPVALVLGPGVRRGCGGWPHGRSSISRVLQGPGSTALGPRCPSASGVPVSPGVQDKDGRGQRQEGWHRNVGKNLWGPSDWLVGC